MKISLWMIVKLKRELSLNAPSDDEESDEDMDEDGNIP